MRIPRTWIATVFNLLVAFVPSGTRYIWRTGSIDGNSVEPGTVSLFGMQLAALGFAVAVFWNASRDDWRRLFKHPVSLLAGLVAAAASISVFQWSDWLAGAVQASFIVTGMLVFWAIMMFRPSAHETLETLVGGALFQTAFGAWQFYTQSSFASKWLGMAAHSADQAGSFVVETASGRWLRAYGVLSHPNVFGLYVGLGVLACVGVIAFRGRAAADESHAATHSDDPAPPPGGWWRFVDEPGHLRHLTYYAFLPLVTAGMVFSMSRSAIIAVLAGFAWIGISTLLRGSAPTFRTVFVPSFVIFLLTSLALLAFYAEPALQRVHLSGRLEAISIDSRTRQFSDALTIFQQHPFSGIGVGRMPLVIREMVDADRPWWLCEYVHNVPALIVVETGVVGLLAWAAFVAAVLRIVWRRLRMPTPIRRAGRHSSGVTAYGAGFIALLIGAQFDHFLWSSWFGQALFWIIAGLLYAAYLDLLDEQEHREPPTASR